MGALEARNGRDVGREERCCCSLQTPARSANEVKISQKKCCKMQRRKTARQCLHSAQAVRSIGSQQEWEVTRVGRQFSGWHRRSPLHLASCLHAEATPRQPQQPRCRGRGGWPHSPADDCPAALSRATRAYKSPSETQKNYEVIKAGPRQENRLTLLHRPQVPRHSDLEERHKKNLEANAKISLFLFLLGGNSRPL